MSENIKYSDILSLWKMANSMCLLWVSMDTLGIDDVS